MNAFEYKDGNCTKATYGLGESDEVTVVYEYYLDQQNKSRYYSQIYSDIFSATPGKNLIKRSMTTIKNNPEYSSIDEYTYEYTNQGFPRQTVITSSNSTRGTLTYVTFNEYACQ